MERWRARLAISGDAPEPEPQPAEPEVAGAEDNAMDEEGGDGGEFRFLGEQEQGQAGDTQALAAATDEQAAAAAAAAQSAAEEEAGAGGMDDGMDEDAPPADDAEDMAGLEQQQDTAAGQADWGAGSRRKPGTAPAEADSEGEDAEAEAEDARPAAEDAEEDGEPGTAAGDSFVTAKLRATSLEDAEGGGEEVEGALLPPLTEARIAELRLELEARLQEAAGGGAGEDADDLVHGRAVWAQCDALTSGLVGDLAEQLRLILEPTLASRLGGDYRTGKRINMKKVRGSGAAGAGRAGSDDRHEKGLNQQRPFH